MPLQTRSRAAVSDNNNNNKAEDSMDQAEESGVAETSSSSSSSRPKPQSPMAAREPLPTAASHYDAPPSQSQKASSTREAASPMTRSRPRSMRSWEERSYRREGSRALPGPGPPPPEAFFSPSPYNPKTHRFSPHRADQGYSQAAANMERREFDTLDMDALTAPDDPLMLGSFSEESPPRDPTGRRSPTSADREPASERKRAPHHQHHHLHSHHPRRSPPPYSYSNHPPYASYAGGPPPSGGREGYYSTPSSHGHRRAYPAPPPPLHYYGGHYPPHGSPPPGYASGGPRASPPYYPGSPPYYHYHPDHPEGLPGPYSPYPHEDEIPPPPPSSTKKRPPPSEYPGSPERQTGTPEKQKTRSPFRSPPHSVSKQKFRPSPFFSASPHIGAYGSFGMDTPSGALPRSEFSPMGPSLEDFTAPFLGERGELGISRSDSREDNSQTPVVARRRIHDESTPLVDVWDEFSPVHGVRMARSPALPPHVYDEAVSHDRPPPKGAAAVTLSGSRGEREGRLHSTPHGSVKKTLWPRSEGPPSGSGGHVRMEIGSAGSLSTRKTLEGINSMMQFRHNPRDSDAPSQHSETYPRGPPPPPHHRSHAVSYRTDMATPIKAGHHYHDRPTPSSGRYHPYPPSSASKYKDYPGSTSKSHRTPQFSSVPPSTGKENAKEVTPKRTPCNCKKSKCLKLYCECFAAERFCQDCNCTDCGNTPTAGAIREKAIKDTRAKNPHAFKPRFDVKNVAQGPTPESGHNMGCRCKRSECLKKYCECFQAGVICGSKCKCVDCLNFAGSQALIDKRRKIKDQRGADFAMRVADEAWKSGRAGGARKLPPMNPSLARRPPAKSPGMHPSSHMMHPSPHGPPPPHYASMPPYYRGPHPYPHMGMPITPAGYPPHHLPPHMQGQPPHGMYPPMPGPPTSARKESTTTARPMPKSVTPASTTPKTLGVRVQFDPASSRKKRKISPGQAEETLPIFGDKFPEQPKTAALAIFSFLSNDDLYNAGLVCKSWSQLAMDGELWKFEK